ncbi:TPA: precorrin-6Y C5,15-methyltransferase (decarboxylating) subunit CbiT [Pseudomonas aeruginosa]|nr:precorrin-6Y C5,15-methyltransferase (decarboxylating) subunit CbiT [Pseudomonas aeruginosa]
MECRAGAGAVRLPLTPGLADEAYRHDGQLTKRDVRAVTLAHLAPCPGELLWDVGAGCGSIGIEWMRAHPSCRAIAIEANDERQEHIRHNRDALGVPTLHLVAGSAPEALLELPEPDAIFIGGGVTAEGVLETCWERLRPGGRLLANAVTLQSERVLLDWQQRLGGDLTRLGVAHARPLGGFDTWRQALPITLLKLRKPAARKPPRDA